MIPNQIKSALILVMIGIMQIANHAVMSQEVALKSGLVIEKRILKGTNLIASAGNPRGILQWQQSTNISTWTDLQDQTRNQLTIPITSTVYLRCAIKETNCDLIYSDVLKVTPFDQPIVSTKAVTGITEIAALSGGNVISEENSPILARGVCWAKTRNPTTGNSVTTDGLGIGDFNSVITGLDGNTVYYVRAYASNIVGTSYGAEVTFKTTASLATVTTAGITGITRISAESGGTVTNDGNAAVTARGVCWSVTQIPTIANNKTTDGTGTGPFTSSITGLTGNQNYFVRAYATNEAGTSYGNEISFRTGALLPVVSTTLVTSITQTSASSGGNVTSGRSARLTGMTPCPTGLAAGEWVRGAACCMRSSDVYGVLGPGAQTGVSHSGCSVRRPCTWSKKRDWSRSVMGPRPPLPMTRPSTSRMGVTSAAVPVKKASSAI